MPDPEFLSVEETKENAAKSAMVWDRDWSIFFRELGRRTGLTLDQCLLFTIVQILRATQEKLTEK